MKKKLIFLKETAKQFTFRSDCSPPCRIFIFWCDIALSKIILSNKKVLVLFIIFLILLIPESIRQQDLFNPADYYSEYSLSKSFWSAYLIAISLFSKAIYFLIELTT